MRNSTFSFWLTAVFLSTAMVSVLRPAPGYADEKVTLCHFPPGNPENPRTIVVSDSAVGTHLDHGDALGDCGTDFVCGNGVVEGSEGCDFPDFADRTCKDVLGEGATGTPSCTSSCELAPGSCQLCGNGIRELTEECDGDDDAACSPNGGGCFDPPHGDACLCDDDGLD
jgi:hypothetical protein